MKEIKIVLDAGTTWSKIIERTSSDFMNNYPQYLVKSDKNFK